MFTQNRLKFLFQAIVYGLAGAFLLVLLRPELLGMGQDSGMSTRAMNGNSVYSFSSAVSRAAPAVVNIHTSKLVPINNGQQAGESDLKRYFGEMPEQQKTENSLGSGVIFSEEGYILTNNHVIRGADEILVALRDGRIAPARIVGVDPESDLAVLQVRLDNLPVIQLGDSELLRIGDVVLAIGNPFGVGQTVTMGIVSAKGRSHLGINTFENFIQTDAAINPGNSGGALVNTNGQLLGINTAIFSKSGGSQGIGFAIPVMLAKNVMQQIIKQGHVSRGWLGVEIYELTPEIMQAFGVQDMSGVIIVGVMQGGPAEAAGLQANDIVIRINDKPVSDVRGALNLIAQTSPNDAITLEVIRDKHPLTLKAVVAERPVIDQ
ncbi:MAG: trypsin-like peptidase domain-containing protein [Gammaproteobacteria bacterium]|nr:trypsin-like peptidase domain-containing protein [Gammaproteobacteria bacterium]